MNFSKLQTYYPFYKHNFATRFKFLIGHIKFYIPNRIIAEKQINNYQFFNKNYNL